MYEICTTYESWNSSEYNVGFNAFDTVESTLLMGFQYGNMYGFSFLSVKAKEQNANGVGANI